MRVAVVCATVVPAIVDPKLRGRARRVRWTNQVRCVSACATAMIVANERVLLGRLLPIDDGHVPGRPSLDPLLGLCPHPGSLAHPDLHHLRN
jgi:hypothetical protein